MQKRRPTRDRHPARAEGRGSAATRIRNLLVAGCLLGSAGAGTAAAQDSTSAAPARLSRCGAATALGALAGDIPGATLSRSGTGSAFFTLRIREEATQTRELRAVVRLTPSSSAAYDLQVRCTSCASSVLGIARPGPGAPGTVRVTRPDVAGDDTFFIVIEVVERAGDRRGPWLLEVAGDQDAPVVRGGAVRCP